MTALNLEDKYHIPRVCTHCNGVLVYRGVGEYICEECGEIDYDDYGKVRNYIETHKGVNAAQIEEAIGISQKIIRQMLKDGRIEVTADSRTFLKCEICDKPIRSGRFCTECETGMHRKLEAEQRERNHKKMQGFGTGKNSDQGQRRFERIR